MNTPVENAMIYNLLLDFKRDVDRRFERIEKTLDEHAEVLKEFQKGQGKTQIKFTSGIFLFNFFATIALTISITFLINVL